MRLLLICLFLLNLLALAAGFGLLGSSEQRGEAERLTNQIHPERLQLDRVSAAPSSVAPSALGTHSNTGIEVVAPIPVEAVPLESITDSPIEAIPPILDDLAVGDEDPGSLRASPLAGEVDFSLNDSTLVCVAYENLTEAQRDDIFAFIQSMSPALRVTTEIIEPPASWWVRIPTTGSRNAAEERTRQLRAQGIADLFIVREPGPNQYAISLGLFRTEASARQHLSDLQARQVRGADIAPRTPPSFTLEITGTDTEVQQLDEALQESNTTLQGGVCAQ